MRFLIGIFTGTVLTLFIATAVDAPTQATLHKAADALSAGWETLIEATSETLFDPVAVTEGATGQDAHPADLLARTKGPREEPATAEGSPAAPLRAAEPAKALPPPAEPAPPPPVKAPPAKAPSAKAPRTIADAPAGRASDDPVPEERVGSAPGPAEVGMPLAYAHDGTGSTAGVWAPFHSQMSAEGFADRLSRALDHDFRVERRGAGAYQVVFDVTSPAQREALLTEIAEITGQ